MAAPLPRFREHLSAPGLIVTLRTAFGAIPDARRAASVQFSMPDTLCAAFAMFSMKYGSMLNFDRESHADPRLIHNLKTLYGLEQVPSDSQMRAILDPVRPEALRPAFEALHHAMQRGKMLEDFTVFGDRYLLAIDGTGQHSSTCVCCPQCCVKKRRGDQAVEFYHQSLAAAIVHPDIRGIALPVGLEPITRADGSNKNDCERNASKRLIDYIGGAFPQRRFIVIEDGLASNGPHIKLLRDKGMDFILGAKPGDHEALFTEVLKRHSRGEVVEFDSGRDADACGEDQRAHGYRFTNAVALNGSHPDLLVNFLEWWEVDKNGKQTIFSWVTNLELTEQNASEIARAARSRWRIENELFNVIKNQGYEFEHNYGHGKQFLSSTLASLMMLAFLSDQIQERACRVFDAARARARIKRTLWSRMREMLSAFRVPGWETYMALLIDPDTVLAPLQR